MNIDNFEETVQRVEGILVIGPIAIYDSMYGAPGPPALEEKQTAIEMMGDQGYNDTTKCDPMMASWRGKSQRWIDPGHGQKRNWSVPERVDSKVSNRWMKKCVQNATWTPDKRTWTYLSVNGPL